MVSVTSPASLILLCVSLIPFVVAHHLRRVEIHPTFENMTFTACRRSFVIFEESVIQPEEDCDANIYNLKQEANGVESRADIQTIKTALLCQMKKMKNDMDTLSRDMNLLLTRNK